MDRDPLTLSVVVPMFNEEAMVHLFAARVRPLLDVSGEAYELLVVDDGSTDNTAALLLGMRRLWPQLRVVRLRRNSGHQTALTAGLHLAYGDYVVSIDADLQDPPEKILDMLALARAQNLDIVYGVRDNRSVDTIFKRRTAEIYYGLMRRVVARGLPHNAGDFRLLSRAAVDVLKQLPEQQPVYRLLVPWIGFPSGEVTYTRAERAAGRTKYPLSAMIRLAVQSLVSFSAAPLRVATWIGLGGFLLCLLLLGYSLFGFFMGNTVVGWTSLFAGVMFIGSIQLVCLGLLGEYVARIYSSLQGRPAYLISYDSAVHISSPEPVATLRS